MRIRQRTRRELHRLAGLTAAALAALLLAGPAAAADRPGESRQEGYYYPPLTSREVFVARSQPQAQAGRATRLGFVTGVTQAQLARPHAPSHVIFAKGEEAEKLIIVAQGQDGFRSLYQARALLAQLTAVVRGSPLLRELAVEDLFTFFDVARLLGFREITVSDGLTFAHRVDLQ